MRRDDQMTAEASEATGWDEQQVWIDGERERSLPVRASRRLRVLLSLPRRSPRGGPMRLFHSTSQAGAAGIPSVG